MRRRLSHHQKFQGSYGDLRREGAMLSALPSMLVPFNTSADIFSSFVQEGWLSSLTNRGYLQGGPLHCAGEAWLGSF